MRVLVFLALFLPALLRAQLAPSAYEAMQAKAPEFLRIDVLRVDVEPGETPEQQKIHIVALISEVVRSASQLKADEIINIVYTVDPAKDRSGPGAIPILKEKDHTVAYLTKVSGSDFEPVAGRMSFSNF